MIQYVAGHQLILGLIPVSFFSSLRASFIFPDQIRASGNVFH